MGLIILALFIGVPLLEIAVFIEIGGLIGLGWTLVFIVATAVAGTALLRYQGISTLARAQQEMNSGRPPVLELLEGVCLLLAACLLLTPGFVTDAFGAALLIPQLRRYVAGSAVRRLLGRGQSGFGAPGHRSGAADGVIDGEFEDITTGNDPERPDEPPKHLT